jgi:hypothetical protein
MLRSSASSVVRARQTTLARPAGLRSLSSRWRRFFTKSLNSFGSTSAVNASFRTCGTGSHITCVARVAPDMKAVRLKPWMAAMFARPVLMNP